MRETIWDLRGLTCQDICIQELIPCPPASLRDQDSGLRTSCASLNYAPNPLGSLKYPDIVLWNPSVETPLKNSVGEAVTEGLALTDALYVCLVDLGQSPLLCDLCVLSCVVQGAAGGHIEGGPC